MGLKGTKSAKSIGGLEAYLELKVANSGLKWANWAQRGPLVAQSDKLRAKIGQFGGSKGPI